MRKTLFCLCLLASSVVTAAELEPLVTLKGLFRQVPERLGLLSPEEKRLRSEFDRVEGGIKSLDAGMALISSEQDMESFFCVLPSCSSLDGVSLVQDRSGLAWNLSAADRFRLAPRAEFVRYQMKTLSQSRAETNVGFGVGLDSSLRLGGSTSAYARAGMLQLSEQNGYEGLFGIATRVDRSRYFFEARWTEMSQEDRIDAGYEFSNIRIGISREFSGL